MEDELVIYTLYLATWLIYETYVRLFDDSTDGHRMDVYVSLSQHVCETQSSLTTITRSQYQQRLRFEASMTVVLRAINIASENMVEITPHT